MKKKNEKRDILSTKGYYTINPIHLKKVLTTQEYDLFDLIRYENNVSDGYISYSLIQLEINIIQRNLIADVKRNLIKLGFITVVEDNRNRGTKYAVNYPVVANLVEILNNERNSVNRLRIADKYRTERGINSIVDNRIKKFENTNFDISVDVDRFTSINNKPIEQVNNKQLQELNRLLKSYLDGNITERQYKVQSNNIKASTDQKIIFDNQNKTWIISTK